MAADVASKVATGASARVDMDVMPRFHSGCMVRARNVHLVNHTRLPRYVRGRLGVVVRDHGVFGFPDSLALGHGPRPQHVYSVRFECAELWGASGSGSVVLIDLWDDYLELAS